MPPEEPWGEPTQPMHVDISTQHGAETRKPPNLAAPRKLQIIRNPTISDQLSSAHKAPYLIPGVGEIQEAQR